MEPPAAPSTTSQNAAFDFHPDPPRYIDSFHQIEDPHLHAGGFDLGLLPECPLGTTQDPFILPDASLPAAPPLVLARPPLQPGNVNATLHSNGDKHNIDGNASTRKAAAALSKTRNKANFPLVCYLCDNEPKYSDVSHLLTHLLSRGHARAKGNIEVRSHIPGDTEAAEKFAAFQKWQDDNGIGALLSERFLDKNNKKKEKDRVEAAKRKRFLDQQSASSKKRKDTFLPSVQADFLDDFNMAPKIQTRGSGGPVHLESHDGNVGLGFLASQNLAYLEPADKDSDNHRIADLMDGSDMISEYASDDNDVMHRVPELKGQFWPGMHLFDSATEENRKKRNQRKDESVLKRMRIGSDAVNPREMVTDMNMTFERYRLIDDEPSDDELTPTKASASKKRTGTPKASVVSEDILKQRSRALASMGERVSTPTKSTPRKSTPRKSTPRKSTPRKSTSRKNTPRKYTPRKQAAFKTPSKKATKGPRNLESLDAEMDDVVEERRTKRGSAARAKSRIAEQAERDTFDDYEALDEDFEAVSPANTPSKRKVKLEAIKHIARHDSAHSSQDDSVLSYVDNAAASIKNEQGVSQGSGARPTANSTTGFVGSIPVDSRSSASIAYRPYYDMGMVQQQQPHGLILPSRFAHGMPNPWPAPGSVFNGYENHASGGAVLVQSPGYYQGFQHQGLQQNPFYQHHHQQSYAYPDQTFHEAMFQEPPGPARPPQALNWNAINTPESPGMYGGHPWPARSPVQSGFPVNEHIGWMDAVHGTSSGNMSAHLEANASTTAESITTGGPGHSITSLADDLLKFDPAKEPVAPPPSHFEDAMEAMGHPLE
ncbi:hypothetical protein ACHAQA_002684 [Verticillium albo-atrum]